MAAAQKSARKCEVAGVTTGLLDRACWVGQRKSSHRIHGDMVRHTVAAKLVRTRGLCSLLRASAVGSQLRKGGL
jgi:hypothetical protein